MPKIGRTSEPDPYKESQDRLYDYEQESLKIDKDALDDELVSQPDNYYQAAREYAIAISYRDEAKLTMEGASADADRRLRKTLVIVDDSEKTKKPTDAQIKQAITLDSKVIATTNDYYAWKSLADRWEALQEAHKQRGHALSTLADLWKSGYFGHMAGSTVRGEAQERAAETVRTAMHRARASRQ